MRSLAVSINLIIALLFVSACGPTAREKLIASTSTAVAAVAKAEESYSAAHQLDIVKAAPDRAAADAELAKFLAARAKLDKAIEATWMALAAAATLQDDPKSFANLQAAAALLATEAVKFLPGSK